MSSSISDSHSRKRGHASVQSEQPRSPWVQTSGPSSWSWTGLLSSYPRTWNGHATMQAVDPVQRPVTTTSSYRSRHWVVSALGILGGRILGLALDAVARMLPPDTAR